jgi:hypothetical protein
MNVLKDIRKMANSLYNSLMGRGGLCLVVLIFVVGFVVLYSNQLGLSRAANTQRPRSTNNNKRSAPDQYPGESAPQTQGHVRPAMPAGLNAGPATAGGARSVTGGVPESCLNRQVANPQDLLPKDANSSWAAANPGGGGQLAKVNLLKAGHHSGIDTVGGTLRNANLQLRSEPPNPKQQVSPWSNSTIEPDLMRVPLELGCGAQ